MKHREAKAKAAKDKTNATLALKQYMKETADAAEVAKLPPGHVRDEPVNKKKQDPPVSTSMSEGVCRFEGICIIDACSILLVVHK